MPTQNATPPTALASAGARRQRGEGLREVFTGLRGALADTSTPLAIVGGALSFTHIRDIAVLAGQHGWTGWAYPLIVDLITVDAYRRLKRGQDTGASPAMPWTWLVIGVTASLGANIADAVLHAPAGAGTMRLLMCVLVGMWPAVAFVGSMLLRHSDKPTGHATTAREPVEPPRAAAGRPTVEPPRRAADRPAAAIVRPADRPTVDPRPIPVHPTGQPDAWRELGPRAATAGELRSDVWVQIGRPVYQQIKEETGGGRPTEAALQQALADRVGALIGSGHLPPAVGRPSLTTAKRIRLAIETAYPELKSTGRPRQLAAATG